MRFSIWSVLILLLMQVNASALPVVIKGKSAAGDAFMFRLYIQKDPISGMEKLADQQRPDQDGHFLLGFEAHKIQMVTIKVGMQSMNLFVEPGKSYQLNFNEITIEDQNVFLPQSPLRVVFENDDMLNLVIDGFEFAYQDFIQNQFIALIKYRDKSIYENFEKLIYEKLKDTPLIDSNQRNFFIKYVEYRLADIRLTSRLEDRDTLGISMIDKQEIQFNNPAYSQFFKKYFDKYILDHRGGVIYNSVKNSINTNSDYEQILDLLGKDQVLIREQIRELVFIYSLKQIYFQRQISKANINSMLNKLSTNSKFELNRGGAANVLKSLLKFQSGASVPDFTLFDLSDHPKSSQDYFGKNTYLMFVSSKCETCETDIRILKSLRDQYKNDLQIVTIFAGFNKDEATNWVQKQNVDWDFLWFNDDFELLNDYDVRNFPKYILLDKKGMILHYFPPKPHEDFLGMIKAIKEKENEVEQESSDFFRKN
jgi:thioredoxin-related protein